MEDKSHQVYQRMRAEGYWTFDRISHLYVDGYYCAMMGHPRSFLTNLTTTSEEREHWLMGYADALGDKYEV